MVFCEILRYVAHFDMLWRIFNSVSPRGRSKGISFRLKNDDSIFLIWNYCVRVFVVYTMSVALFIIILFLAVFLFFLFFSLSFFSFFSFFNFFSLFSLFLSLSLFFSFAFLFCLIFSPFLSFFSFFHSFLHSIDSHHSNKKRKSGSNCKPFPSFHQTIEY